MVAFLPGLVLALVCVVLLVYAFRSHERHWSLGFLGWHKVYAGLGLSLAGAIIWALGLWLAGIPGYAELAIALPLSSGAIIAIGLSLVVVGSMERLRDLAEERRRLEEVRAGFDLYDTLREVVSGPYTFLEVLEFALKEMVRASGVTSGGLWLYNPSGREWILTGAANMNQNFRRQVETVRGTGTGFDRLARLHKAHVFSRLDEIRMFFPEWEAEGLQSVLGLPLVTGTPGSSEKRLLGVIILADSSAARFDDDRTRRLHAAADYVAAVIAEGRLQRQLESSSQHLEALKSAHERDVESLQDQMRAADARLVDERRAWEAEMSSRTAQSQAELAEIKLRAADNLTGAKHQADVAVARLEELRRGSEEEKRRMAEEAQSRINSERSRYDQALTQIRALEAAQQSLTAQIDEQGRMRESERHSHDLKIEALDGQFVRERQSVATEHQRVCDGLQQRISELEMLLAAVEQEHGFRMTELRTQVDEERHHSVDEQRVLKQEIQSLRMTFADQQALHAAERDALSHIRDEYEERLSSLQDQVQMLEEALMAPPPGLIQDEQISADSAPAHAATNPSSPSPTTTHELHGALLEWVAQQEQDEWHLELSAHNTPQVDMEWLSERLDEARRTCRQSANGESIGFAVRTLTTNDRTLLSMTRLSALVDEGEDEPASDETPHMVSPVEPPATGIVSRWIYDGDDRIGMEISFGPEMNPASQDVHEHSMDEAAHQQAHSLSILVVEDQPAMQELLTGMLTSLGHNSAVATSAQEAYGRYVGESFDVVVISADLPQEEGHTLAQWIKSHRVEMPIVMMSDSGSDEMMEMVDAVLVKPFAIEQLHESLLSLTENDFSSHVSVSGYDEGEGD